MSNLLKEQNGHHPTMNGFVNGELHSNGDHRQGNKDKRMTGSDHSERHRIDEDMDSRRDQSGSDPFSNLVRVRPPCSRPDDKDQLDRELSTWFEDNGIDDGLIVPNPTDLYTLNLCGHGVTQETALASLSRIKKLFTHYTLVPREMNGSPYITPLSRPVQISAALSSVAPNYGTANLHFKGKYRSEEKSFVITAGHVMFNGDNERQQNETYEFSTHTNARLRGTEWCIQDEHLQDNKLTFQSSPEISYQYFTDGFLRDTAILPVLSKSSDTVQNFFSSLPLSSNSYTGIYPITANNSQQLDNLNGVQVKVGSVEGEIIVSAYSPNSAANNYGKHLSFTATSGSLKPGQSGTAVTVQTNEGSQQVIAVLIGKRNNGVFDDLARPSQPPCSEASGSASSEASGSSSSGASSSSTVYLAAFLQPSLDIHQQESEHITDLELMN